MYFREAEFEAAKAQLAKTNNIAPKGVTYDSFPKQQDERRSRTDSAKAKAESAKASVTSQRDNVAARPGDRPTKRTAVRACTGIRWRRRPSRRRRRSSVRVELSEARW